MENKPVTIEYHQIRNYAFMQAMQKIANLPLSAKGAYRLKKTIDKVEAGMKTVRTEYKTEVLDKFYQKNDDGSYKPASAPGEQGSLQFVLNEGFTTADVTKAEEEFSKKVMTLDVYKLSFAELGDAKFTAGEVNSLEGVIDFEGAEDKPAATSELAKIDGAKLEELIAEAEKAAKAG
jgi:hypothetical protein